MALYITIIGLGIFIGILLNFHSNLKIPQYKTIGLIIILITGIFAFFVILDPFFFKSYSDLVLFLTIAAVSLFIIYITALFAAYKSLNKRQAGNSDMENICASEPDQVKEDVHLQDFRQDNKAMDTREIKIASQPEQSDKPRLYVQKREKMEQPKETAADYTQTKYETATLPVDIEIKNASAIVYAQPDQADEPLPNVQKETETEQPDEAEPQQNADQGSEEARSLEQNKTEVEIIITPAEPDQAEKQEAEVNDIESVEHKKAEGIIIAPAEPAQTGQEKDDNVQQADSESQRDEKYWTIAAKANELMNRTKYLFAIELFQVCLNGTEDRKLQKKADIKLLECLVLSNQHNSAQKKWFEILNKKYDLEPMDKVKLKEIMSKLKQ